jgi:hypothetical protein
MRFPDAIVQSMPKEEQPLGLRSSTTSAQLNRREAAAFCDMRSNRRRVKNPRALCPPKILLLLRKFARFACNCAATTVTRTTSFELQLFWMRSSQIGIPRRRKDRQTVASDADVGW